MSDSEIRNCVVPAARIRWILLHYHIFKNAGSTVEYILSRTFREKFVTLHGPNPDSLLNSSDVLGFLAANPDVMAISSHHFRFPVPASPELVVFDLCFLRDPLQRIWSMYRYMRRVEAVDEVGRMARTMDFRGFVDALMSEHPHLINDVQVNILARGGAYTCPPSEPHFRVALDTLQRMSVPGVVDLFDESLVAAEYFLRPAFPELQLQYVRKNVTPTDGDTSVRPDLRDELGSEIYSRFWHMNRFDEQLVAHARAEIMRRYDMVPDRDARRADFERRCAHLESVHENLTATARATL